MTNASARDIQQHFYGEKAMPEKNKTYETQIDTMNHQGYGICRINGVVCFVKGGVTGDLLTVKIIKVAKSYCVGRIEEIKKASYYRVNDNCPVYKQCGGCSFRHIKYEHELELKKSFVEAEFHKNGLDVKINDTFSTGDTCHYRNKAQYPVSFDGKIGFYAERTHTVCESDGCLLQPPVFSEITALIKSFIQKYNINGYDELTGKGLLRHIYLRQGKNTGEIMVCLCINGRSIPHSDELVESLKQIENVKSIMLNINTIKTNVILGDKYITLWGNDYIEDILCGNRFRISPASFYQVNHDCAEKLYEKASELVQEGKCDNITDLYCGTGTIGLCIASKINGCKLTGVEIVPEAIENAKINAKLNNIDNASFVCADSADVENGVLDNTDVVILDPPRKGITKELAEKISQSGIERIVYISCSPDTLARDVKIFTELGYTCGDVTPYDMFPRTGHVESVVCITKQ